MLCERAFEVCGLQRVEFKTDRRNERTRGALLALGAQFEGIARKHMMLPTGPRDSAWYALTEDDWPEAKARLLWRLSRMRELKARRGCARSPSLCSTGRPRRPGDRAERQASARHPRGRVL